MKVLKIDPTEDTPAILLDADKGVFKIIGISMPEDAHLFYQPMTEWISQYCTKPNPKTNFVFELEYFNSASSQSILNIIRIVEEIHNHKTQAAISWLYYPDNKDMKEAGKLFAELVTIPFKLIIQTQGNQTQGKLFKRIGRLLKNR